MGTNLFQNADGSIGFRSEELGYDIAKIGGGTPLNTSAPTWRMPFAMELAIQGPTDTAGALMSIANPFGRSFYITDTLMVVTTQSAGACTVSIGCAANGTTLNATLISGANVAAVGIFGGGLLANRQIWTSALFLTGSTASGASSGLVGRVLVMGYLL